MKLIGAASGGRLTLDGPLSMKDKPDGFQARLLKLLVRLDDPICRSYWFFGQHEGIPKTYKIAVPWATHSDYDK
jgi:hypothetical protein